jgi:hypothetical protein
MQLCQTPSEAAAYWRTHITPHPYFNPECECLVVLTLIRQLVDLENAQSSLFH